MNRCNAEHIDSALVRQTLNTTGIRQCNCENHQSSGAAGSNVAMRREMQDIQRSGLSAGLSK